MNDLHELCLFQTHSLQSCQPNRQEVFMAASPRLVVSTLDFEKHFSFRYLIS